MKKTALFTAGILLASIAFASTDSVREMTVMNNSDYVSNAYFHEMPSPLPAAPHSTIHVPWSALTKLCHGAGLTASDPCTMQIYATKSEDPKQYDVAVVTFYLSNGAIVNITDNPNKLGLHVASMGAAHLEMVG